MSKLQDVDRCVKCGHRSAPLLATGLCASFVKGARCPCKCEFPSPSVSAEDRCVDCGHNDVNRNGYCLLCVEWRRHICEFTFAEAAPAAYRTVEQGDGSVATFADTTNPSVSEAAPEYSLEQLRVFTVRVHQPPEQNLEDKNSVSPKPRAPSRSSVVIPESNSLDADRVYLIRNPYATRDVDVSRAEYLEAMRSVGIAATEPRDFKRRGVRGRVEQPSTSDVLGNPDRGISSRSEPESSSESESTLVTAPDVQAADGVQPEVSKEQDK